MDLLVLPPQGHYYGLYVIFVLEGLKFESKIHEVPDMPQTLDSVGRQGTQYTFTHIRWSQT